MESSLLTRRSAAPLPTQPQALKEGLQTEHWSPRKNFPAPSLQASIHVKALGSPGHQSTEEVVMGQRRRGHSIKATGPKEVFERQRKLMITPAGEETADTLLPCENHTEPPASIPGHTAFHVCHPDIRKEDICPRVHLLERGSAWAPRPPPCRARCREDHPDQLSQETAFPFSKWAAPRTPKSETPLNSSLAFWLTPPKVQKDKDIPPRGWK